MSRMPWVPRMPRMVWVSWPTARRVCYGNTYQLLALQMLINVLSQLRHGLDYLVVPSFYFPKLISQLELIVLMVPILLLLVTLESIVIFLEFISLITHKFKPLFKVSNCFFIYLIDHFILFSFCCEFRKLWFQVEDLELHVLVLLLDYECMFILFLCELCQVGVHGLLSFI